MEHIKNVIERYKHVRNMKMLQQAYQGKYAFVGIGNHSTNNLYPVLNYLHVPLKYICCKTPGKLHLIEGVFPHVRATTSLDEVLTDEDIKGVFVSVSSKAHFSIASRVLAHKKALFIEKPPCLNAEELRRLIELQKQTQVLAMVDLQKRFAPAMQILKKKLQGSKGTKTYNLKFLTGAYPEGDALLDLFIHPIDCVVYLFGKAEVRCVEPIDEHTVMLVLKHADAIGVLELSTDYTWSDAKESMTINTNKGIYSLEQMETLTFQRKPHRFCGLPLEKVLMHVNVTAELFGRNNFQPLMQNNQVFTQGYYTAAGLYAYDNNDSASKELTLRDGADEINKQLEEKLDERLSMAGIEVVEARINYLAYAPEIAAVMLRRQQADAIISAREKIVEGAVSMVKMALDKLSSEDIVELDDDKKAAMVSNLLVVLCGDDSAQPVVNTGTLNH